MSMLTIESTSQGNGWTFRLSPESRLVLQRRFGRVGLATSLFIGTDGRPDYGQIHLSMWNHVAMLLTGVGLDELEQVGGYQVIDMRSGRAVPHRGKSNAN